MKATELEKTIITSLLDDRDLNPIRSVVDFDAIAVSDREFTGAGFLTEFVPSEQLRLFAPDVSLRWGNVGARLNADRVETGYLVYVDEGCLTGLEGYTYGDEWPREVKEIELYDLKPGMELTTKPRR